MNRKKTEQIPKAPKPPLPRKKLWWVLGAIFLVLLLGIGGTLTLLSKDPEASAEAADRYLRPILGERGTIAFEGFILGLQDKINHYRYKQPPAADYQVGVAVVAVTPQPTSIPNQPSAVPTATPVPAPTALTLGYDASAPLPGEGTWSSITGTPLFTTFIRTDSTRPYAVVNLVYIPLKTLGIAAVAGTQHPGGELGIPGPGKVPDSIQQTNSLVAAFNGGFQEKDGHYGMIVNGTTYVPLRNGLGMLSIYQDGHVTIGNYDGKPLPTAVVAVRQNGPLLVQNGQDNQLTSQGVSLWAGTASGDYITWRSGIGITANGDLVYAVGPSLTPTALADALRLAGSVNAMQLDINAFWVRFMVYQSTGNGTYSYAPLTKALTDAGTPYLTGYEKDFFYLYKK